MLETGELSKVTSYITVGDQYTDKRDKPLHETRGVRQFQTTGGVKSGQTGGDWGESYRKVKPLYQASLPMRTLAGWCCVSLAASIGGASTCHSPP